MQKQGYLGGNLSDVKRVGGMEPHRKISSNDFFQQDGRVGFRTKQKGVVIESIVLDAVVRMPVTNFFKNVLGVSTVVTGVN